MVNVGKYSSPMDPMGIVEPRKKKQKTTTSYFPLNPDCLINILIMCVF